MKPTRSREHHRTWLAWRLKLAWFLFFSRVSCCFLLFCLHRVLKVKGCSSKSTGTRVTWRQFIFKRTLLTESDWVLAANVNEPSCIWKLKITFLSLYMKSFCTWFGYTTFITELCFTETDVKFLERYLVFI